MTWNEVPAYVPVQPNGTGLHVGETSVYHVTRESFEFSAATWMF